MFVKAAGLQTIEVPLPSRLKQFLCEDWPLSEHEPFPASIWLTMARYTGLSVAVVLAFIAAVGLLSSVFVAPAGAAPKSAQIPHVDASSAAAVSAVALTVPTAAYAQESSV